MSRALLRSTAAVLLVPALLAQGKEPKRLVAGAVGERIATFAAASGAFGFSGAVIAATGGKVVAALGVGSADLDGKVPNDAYTLFELASATKQITAAAVLVLVQTKKLKLDDPIHEHLPGVPADCRAITIRHLLQHTSGIPGSNAQGAGDDLAAVLPSFLKGGPKHTPGTHWEYWNQGYALLAEIIERTSGDTYGEFCTKRLFAPAKAVSMCFTGDKAPDKVPDKITVAIGRGRAEPRSALDHPYGAYGFQYKGMGGAVANLWDLWHWDRALRGEAVLKAAQKKELFAPGLEDYALGWFVRKREGRLVHQHGGSVRGFICDVKRFPDDDAFVAVLCNRDDGPMGEVSNGVEAILFGGTIEVPPPLPAKAGEELVGTWESDRGKLVIERHDDRLRAVIQWTQYPPSRGFVTGAELGKAAFFDWNTQLPITIARDGGKVTSLQLGPATFRRG